jgi:hypothetical protein
MNKQIKKTPLSHFHLIKKATMDDFKDISEWLKDAFENHKEFKGYGLYHNLDGFILDAFNNGSLKFEITAKRLYAASQRVL